MRGALPFFITCFSIACVGDNTVTPTDSGADQTAADGPTNDTGINNGDGGDGAVSDPTWTVPLPARSSLSCVAIDNNQNVLVAGQVQAPLALAPINIASTQGIDIFVAKFDGKTKAPVWGVSYGGAGDDAVTGCAWTPNGLFIVGTTTGAAIQFGGQSLPIPQSTGGIQDHSFFARIDPSDGTVGWVLSPDANRSPSLAHDSNCLSIAASGANFSIGCTYSGNSFSWDASHPAWNSGTTEAFAIMHFTDGPNVPTQQWTKSLAAAGSPLYFPTVALDPNGDTWVSGTFRASTSTLRDQPSNTQILAATANATPFILKIANGSQAVAPAKGWAADSTNYVPTLFTGLAATSSQVFAVGRVLTSGNDGNFGTGPITSQGFDMFGLGLDTSLSTQWFFTLGGAGIEGMRGIALDGTNIYTGMDWGSVALVFGATTLPDPATNTTASGIAKLDSSGKAVSALAVSSVAASVHMTSVLAGPSALYAVGSYGGDTTWDDGTTATGNSTDGNGFLMRRKKF